MNRRSLFAGGFAALVAAVTPKHKNQKDDKEIAHNALCNLLAGHDRREALSLANDNINCMKDVKFLETGSCSHVIAADEARIAYHKELSDINHKAILKRIKDSYDEAWREKDKYYCKET